MPNPVDVDLVREVEELEKLAQEVSGKDAAERSVVKALGKEVLTRAKTDLQPAVVLRIRAAVKNL